MKEVAECGSKIYQEWEPGWKILISVVGRCQSMLPQLKVQRVQPQQLLDWMSETNAWVWRVACEEGSPHCHWLSTPLWPSQGLLLTHLAVQVGHLWVSWKRWCWSRFHVGLGDHCWRKRFLGNLSFVFESYWSNAY